MRERMLWVALGVVSLLLAAGLGLATSALTKAPVGLSAEPVSAGEALAPSPTADPTPAATREPRKRRRPKPTPTPRPAPTAVPTSVPTAPSDDHSGHGSGSDDSGSDDSGGDDSSGRGRGRSGDDD
jgi:hypothetical protein